MNIYDLLREPGQVSGKQLWRDGKATRVLTGYETKYSKAGSTKRPQYAYIPNESFASTSNKAATKTDKRSTGEYDDVINSLQIEQEAAKKRAEELQKQQAEKYQADFAAMSKTYQEQINQLNTANTANLESLNLQYDQQAQEFSEFQELAASQLATAESNYQDQRRMTENLQSAFVPEPNPSAFNASVGDQRTQAVRQQRNNKLSDLSSLSIISGLGTASNPLSGLQLA